MVDQSESAGTSLRAVACIASVHPDVLERCWPRGIEASSSEHGLILSHRSVSMLVSAVRAALRDVRTSWSAAIVVGEVHDANADLASLAQELAAVADRRQIVLDLTAAEILRPHLQKDDALDDLGVIRVRDDRPVRLFRLRSESKHDAWRPSSATWYATSMIGRERELSELLSMADGSRLISIVGVPGVGKTHLLRRFGSLLEADSQVVYVDVRAVAAPDLIWTSLLNSLGESVLSGESHQEACLRLLRSSRSVAVFDGCERSTASIRRTVTTILAECPNVLVLIGSLSPIRLPDEQVFRLRGLSTEPSGAPTNQNGRCEAVDLFVDRASLADRLVQFDANAILCVQAICKRLDGNPLAIELAAAKLSAFSPRQLLDRLEDRLSLLSSKRVDGRKRLREFLDWGFDSLSPLAQTIAIRFAIFHGAASIDAILSVCGEEFDNSETIEACEELIDAAWLESAPLRTPERMFYFPETLRLYCAEKLAADAVAPSVRKRHEDFLREFAVNAEQPLRGPRAGEWMERFAAYYTDITEFIAADLRPDGDIERAVSTFVAGSRFWVIRGWAEEGLSVIAKIETRPATRTTSGYGRLLAVKAGYLVTIGRDDEAIRTAVAALKIARGQNDQFTVAVALNAIGGALRVRRPDQSARFTLRSANRYRRVGDSIGELTAIANYLCLARGPFAMPQSIEAMGRGDALAERMDDPWIVASFHHSKAYLECEIGRFASAIESCRRATKLYVGLGSYASVRETLDIACRATMEFDVAEAAHIYAMYAAFDRMAADEITPRDDAYSAAVRAEIVERVGEDALQVAVQQFGEIDPLIGLNLWIG